jgi:hypothetical protein
MQTLSYGFKLPEDGDKGAPLFQALEDNITRVNDHNHDGANSSPLTATSIVGVPANILSANWVANGPTGFYRQLVTLPPGFDFDLVQISMRLSTGDYVSAEIEKVSDTQYYVYTIDNTVSFVAVYGG